MSEFLLISYHISGTHIKRYSSFDLALERARMFAEWVDWEIIQAQVLKKSKEASVVPEIGATSEAE